MALLDQLLQPFPLLLLLSGAWLLRQTSRRSEPRFRGRWLWLLYGLLLIDTSPAVAFLITSWWEQPYPVVVPRPLDAKAIIVLGADVRLPETDGEPTRLGEASWVRTERAVELYEQGPPIPIVVCGGRTDRTLPGDGVAVPMGAYLRHRGVAAEDIVLETESVNTVENAANAVRLLRERGIHSQIVVVSHAFHLRRSERIFRKLNVTVTCIGTGHRSAGFRWDWTALVPKPRAALFHQEVFHEWLSLAWWRLRGKL